MTTPTSKHSLQVPAEASTVSAPELGGAPRSASDGLRETLKHSQEMGYSAISLMLKADIEAIEPCLKDSHRLDALLELDIDVKPADGGGWLLVDWRANPPRTTEHKTGREAIDAALSSPNVQDEPRRKLAPEAAPAAEVPAVGVGSSAWLGSSVFIIPPGIYPLKTLAEMLSCQKAFWHRTSDKSLEPSRREL
jgi:hypothetical protein